MDSRSARSNFIGASISAALVLLFSLILLGRDPLVFWNDDYQISILPVFDDVARSWREGHWPLLSPYSWVCGNLAGEFQYGTFSVFINAAVVIIWSIFRGFAHQAAALSIVHLMVLAAGGFVLARSRGIAPPLAMMVSLIVALNGWIICWGASDWFGALGAFAWLPWTWWGLEKALGDVALASSQWTQQNHRPAADGTKQKDHGQDSHATFWRFLWPAPFVYLAVTGGFPYTVLMLVLLIAWLSIKSLVQSKSIMALAPMLIGSALGFGLAAPAVLAIFNYVHGSAREMQPPLAHWQWIVPPGALPGFVLPCWTVKWADFSTRYMPHAGTELACGLVAPAALIAGFVHQGRSLIRRFGWELALLGIVLLISMLPTAGVFRWSFRWLPFVHLILAITAAESLRLLGESEKRAPHRILRLASPAAVVLVLSGITALTMVFSHKAGRYGFPLTWVLLAIAIGSAGFELLTKRHSQFQSWMPAAVTFASLLATYLCIPTNCGVPRYNFTEELTNPAPLDRGRLYLSIYPVAEIIYRRENWPRSVGQIVRPGSTSMWARLAFINGYSPIRPSGVAREFLFAIHGEIDYFMAARALTQEAGPNGLLTELGVDGITVASDWNFFKPQPEAEWEVVASAEEGRVYHRRGPPLPRVRSVASLSSRPGQEFAVATISAIHNTRNYVDADVEVSAGSTSALLTFSRPYFPGYEATLDGTKLKVDSARGLFPIVEIPPGSRGRLVLCYRPAWLVYGGALATLSALVWLTGVIMAAARRP